MRPTWCLGDVWAFYIRTDTHRSGLLLGSFIGLLNPPAPARRTAATAWRAADDVVESTA
ncbi:hypothetical protein [Thauera butanivorans]|uniref:hypothetical protein n=1 Tax=Thauera butanivorans TaxID=86174 RepID=UPI000B0CA0B8|nr:hypothetical protein [Thauera butanivorans]